MERNSSKKKSKQFGDGYRKINYKSSKRQQSSSVSEEAEETHSENEVEDSPTFKGYYSDYLSRQNGTDTRNKDACKNSEEDLYHTEDDGENVTKGKNRTLRGSSRSRSPRRSRRALSRKGSKRASSRKGKRSSSRNGKSSYDHAEKSPKRSGSQLRNAERKSSRNSVKLNGIIQFRSVVKKRVWVPKKNGKNSGKTDETLTSDSESEVATSRSCEESESDTSKCDEREEEHPATQEEQRESSKDGKSVREDKNERRKGLPEERYSPRKPKRERIKQSNFNGESSNDMSNRETKLQPAQEKSSEKESADESASSAHSSQTYTLVEDDRRFSPDIQRVDKNKDEKKMRRRKERKSSKREKRTDKASEFLCTDEGDHHLKTNGHSRGNDTPSSYHGNDTTFDHHSNGRHDNDRDTHSDHHGDETQSVSSVNSSHLARLCAKYNVNSDSTLSEDESDNDLDSAQELYSMDNTKKAENDTNDNHVGENHVTSDTNGNLGIDVNAQNGAERRSVTSSNVVEATQSVTKDTDGDLSKRDIDRLVEEIMLARKDEQSFDEDPIQKERDEFREEIHRLHTELVQFKQQCEIEAEEYRIKLERKRAKFHEEYKSLEENEQQEKRSSDPADGLKRLGEEYDILKRKQRLLDMEDALIAKEEELSQRNKELQDYEKEVEEIEGFLNRRHDLTKRKETEILELDEELSKLKESLRIKKANVQSEMGVDSENEESKKKSRENWELLKESIDTKALTMQSTVKKYKADLATAENTMSDLHQKVDTLEEKLAKRERKIKELDLQLSLTISQVISNNRDNIPVNKDDHSGTSDPSPATVDTLSTDMSSYNISDMRRHSMSSALVTPNTASLAPRGSRASLTPQGLGDPLLKNPLKPRWHSLREPKGPDRPKTDSKAAKNGWRPVSRALSDSVVPVTPPNSSGNSTGRQNLKNDYDSPNRNLRSNACVIS